MDEFVRNQLTLIGCEDLIQLFKDKGYNEEAYRKLNNLKLIQLLPDDDDGELAFKIMCNIRGLNNSDPDSCSSTHSGGHFPPPTVVVKTESLDLAEVKHPAPTQGGDDEVQIVKVTIRAPSGFTRMEIKQEPVEEQSEDIVQASSSSSLPVSDNHNESDFNHVEIEQQLHDEEGSTGSVDKDQPSSSSSSSLSGSENQNGPERTADNARVQEAGNADVTRRLEHENWCSDYRGKVRQNLWPRKRAGDTMDMELQPKTKRNNVTEVQWWKFIHSVFGVAPGRVTKAKLEQRFGDNLEFNLSAPAQFDDVLRLIETYSDRLSQFVKKLELTLPKPDDEISNPQIRRLANLPTAFLCQLTKMTFNITFSETTDFSLITTLLSKCPNLTDFAVHRGVILARDEGVSFQVPKMDNLVSFEYATIQWISARHYDEPPTPVDVESDKCAMDDFFFQIDFGNVQFPALEKLEVGPFIVLEFARLSQFPNLTFFEPGHINRPLAWLNDDSTCERVREISFDGVIRMELIRPISLAFANITHLQLAIPTVGNLCGIIREMKNMHIESFSVTVNFEFESALLTALRGIPFKLVTEQDKIKFTKVQEYKHWKGFLKHLGIEFPTGSGQPCKTDEELYKDGETSTTKLNETTITTIDSFKFLKTFEMQHIIAWVHLPTNDAHWNSSDVQLSPTRWSSNKPAFPKAFILYELTKLKGQLKHVNLRNFQVGYDTLAQFEQIMDFKISFDSWGPPREVNQDTFSPANLAEDPTTREIKQEK